MTKLFLIYQNAAAEANNAESQDQGRKSKLRNAQTLGQELAKKFGSMLMRHSKAKGNRSPHRHRAGSHEEIVIHPQRS
jgi:hypothetical protein